MQFILEYTFHFIETACYTDCIPIYLFIDHDWAKGSCGLNQHPTQHNVSRGEGLDELKNNCMWRTEYAFNIIIFKTMDSKHINYTCAILVPIE